MTRNKSQRHSKIRLFCEISSIRGMHKIIKARTRFLRVLWMLFVFTMTTALFITSVFLILDYLNYDTAWHTSTKLDYRPEFPSITVCSHNPFATFSDTLWKEGKVMTPKSFSELLVNVTFEGLKKQDRPLASMNLFDDLNTYYSNLRPNDSRRLGHHSSMMRYCLILNFGFITVAENCSDIQQYGFQVRLFSHSRYLNCYTIEGEKPNSTVSVESIILLVSITPITEVKGLEDRFAFDMIHRGEGLKVTIHQRGTFPDIVRHGINIEPGKMNEITYETTEWKRHSTPKVECKDDQMPITDLGHQFSYTLQQCLESVLQQQMIESCGCLHPVWPRIRDPSDELPYCLKIEKDLSVLSRRIECAENVMVEARKLKKEAEGVHCYPQCTYHSYNLHTSVTKWNPSSVKLQTLTTRYSNFEHYMKYFDDTLSFPRRDMNATDRADFEAIQATIRENLKRKISSQNNSLLDKLFSGDRFSFLRLQRRNFDITIKLEKLVFDLNILASRIGGLCSLCIGLTAAFAIEIVEFLYLYFGLGDTEPAHSNDATRQPMKEANADSVVHCHRRAECPAGGAASGGGGSLTRRGRMLTYSDEDNNEGVVYGRYGIGNNHFSDSPWFKMNAETSKCAHCGRNVDSTPISSV